MTWRDGYQWTFTYGANDRLTTITDTFGRSLGFTWIMQDQAVNPSAPTILAAISEVQLPDGNAVRYHYDSIAPGLSPMFYADRLVRVEQVNSGGTITESTMYHFEDPTYPQYVTGITDGRGVRVTNYAYDGLGRAVMSETVGGVDKLTVSYNDTPPNLTRKSPTPWASNPSTSSNVSPPAPSAPTRRR